MELERAYTPDTSSDAPRIAAVLAHTAQLAVAFAILDRSGPSFGRVFVLAPFAWVYWFRGIHRATSRRGGSLSWRDFVLAATATGTYQIGFAWLGAQSSEALGARDAVAALLYVCGVALSTAADVLRDRFRLRAGASSLCVRGPFAVVRYPKYLGDVTWASAWALATRGGAAWLLVSAHAALLVLVYIPALDRRLAARHGAGFRAWAARTRRLLPFVY